MSPALSLQPDPFPMLWASGASGRRQARASHLPAQTDQAQTQMCPESLLSPAFPI